MRGWVWPVSSDVHGILRDAPRPGDIHSGVVVEVLASRQFRGKPRDFDLYTIEGDTDEFGRLERGKAMRVRRRLSAAMGDRFLRWTELARSTRILTYSTSAKQGTADRPCSPG